MKWRTQVRERGGARRAAAGRAGQLRGLRRARRRAVSAAGPPRSNAAGGGARRAAALGALCEGVFPDGFRFNE